MSRKTRTNFNDIFDKGLDNMSDLVNQFTKKNKRVHRIFDVEDDDVPADEQSYGLRLVSVNETDGTTGKENASKVARRSSTTVRPLSPVQIVEAPPEQILESRSPFKHPSQLSNRQNVSLRRSLFQPKPKNNDIICSTPSTRNQATSNDFFGSSSSRIESLSPIKKGLSNTIITMEDLKGIDLISPTKDNQNGAVKSLQNLEKDLREQFQIDQQTPKKSYSKSLAGDTSRRAASETKNQSPSRRSFRSEPISRSQPTQECSVIVEPMEMSKDTISMYRKTQLSRLSTSNVTNVNTFNMIETPIARQTKHSAINDSLLAKKLALCDSDSQLTDDVSDPPDKLRTSVRQSQSKKQNTVETDENITNDESSKELEPQNARKTVQNIESTPKKVPSRRPSRLTRNSEPMSMSEDESDQRIDPKANGKSKEAPAVEESAESEDESLPKVQKAAKKTQKSSKKTQEEVTDPKTSQKSKGSKQKQAETQVVEELDESEDECPLQVQKASKKPQKGNENTQAEVTDSKTVQKSKGSKQQQEKVVVEEESEESEYESFPEAQIAPKDSQKGNKKDQEEVSENEQSESEYSDVLSSVSAPKVKTPPKTKKSTANVKDKKPDPPKPNKKAEKVKENPSKNKKNGKNKKPESEESGSDVEVEEEVPQFKKPRSFKKSLRENILCNMSNVSAGSLVPTEIIESFRTLQKPDTNSTTALPETSKITRPKGSKSRTVNPNKNKIAEYLRLEKTVKQKKPKKEAKSRKRTLYNQNSDDDEKITSQHSQASTIKVPEVEDLQIDHELSEELSAVRRSIDTMSNASSQPFSATIPSQNNNVSDSEDEQPQKKAKTPNKKRIVDESDEEMKIVHEAPKQRGRPKKIIQNTAAVAHESDQEVENIPKSRNQPKKIEKKKVPAKKQQVTAPDDESEEETAPKVVKKPRMLKELMSINRKSAIKRQHSSKDETEPPRKTRRRVANSLSDESNSETSKNTDEGFQSDDEDEYDDVWYDPVERGCQRQGLRVRKFTRSKDGKYAIQYGVFTKADSKAAQLQKKYNIKESDIHTPTLAPFIQPVNRLELIQAIIMEKKLKKSEPPKKKEVAPRSKKVVEKVNDGASTSRQAMETESVASFATARTDETQSGVINRLLDNFNRLKGDSTEPINLVETNTYAISQINKLVWHSIGAGVFYSSFKENSFDGFLKLVKGGYKKGARTKLAVVKMTLLCGVVDIKINDTKLRIENLGFITITRGQSYRIMNASDETAIILMTRLDDEEATNANQNSS